MPDVSVIIPCYNHAHYLPYAVNSVLAQTFAGWEAIIVDDGSTDDTRETAASFADPRVRYIYQENRGLAAARNAGIRASSGKYLAFLDADDEWEPAFIERCKGRLDQEDAPGFVHTRNYFIDPQGARLPQIGGQALSGEPFRSRLLQGGFFPPHAAILRRHILAIVGDFDTALTSVEDWDLWLRISDRYPVEGIDEALARYRVYPGSMSTNAARMHANRMAVLSKLFGPAEGDPLTWPADMLRACAFAHRDAALDHFAQQQVDTGWRHLGQAVEFYPGLLERLDTFYELVCGNQQRGYRGVASQIDLSQREAFVMHGLRALFASMPAASYLERAAYGNAHLAFGLLSELADDFERAKRHYRQASILYPRLIVTSQLGRKLVKLFLWNSALKAIRRRGTSISPDPKS